MLDGHLLDLEGVTRVEAQTRVRRRTEVPWALRVTGDIASLYFYGKEVKFPAYLEPELRFVAEGDEFNVAEVSSTLDEPGKLLLVRTLINEGFLTICRHSPLPEA